MAHTYCTGQGLGNDGFLYYTMHCTHYTGTEPLLPSATVVVERQWLRKRVKNLVHRVGGWYTPLGRHPRADTHTPWADSHPTPPPQHRHSLVFRFDLKWGNRLHGLYTLHGAGTRTGTRMGTIENKNAFQ